MNDDKCFAAIDLGSNSCRMVVSKEDGTYLYNEAFSPRMGAGLHKDLTFTEETINRGLGCLVAFREKLREYNIVQLRAIATAACRMAKNATEFVALVYETTGIRLEIIDAYEEARLNLKGALMNVRGKGKYVILYDLGGASTEITLATNEEKSQILYTVSIPWGARNASEVFNLEEPNSEGAEKLAHEIKRWVQGFVLNANLEAYRKDACFEATSSTPLRLASMAKKFSKYDRDKADGVTVKTKDLDAVIAKIMKMSRQQMEESPYIGAKRSYIFRAAAVIFQTIYQGLNAPEITASLKSAKDGIIEELIMAYRKTEQDNG